MSLLARLNGRFKIGTRIGAGFLLILALLVAVAANGYFGLDATRSAFDLYGRVSINSVRVTEIDSQFVSIRRNVLIYVGSGDDKAQARVREQAKTLNDLLTQTHARLAVPERQALLKKIQDDLGRYMKNFDVIVTKRAERDHAVNQVMNPLGVQLRTLLTEVVDGALLDEDMAMAALAGVTQERLMQMRISTLLFLLEHDQSMIKRVDELKKDLSISAQALAEVARNPTRQAKVRQFSSTMPKYNAAFDSAVVLINERERLVNDVGAKIADELAHGVEALKDMQLKSLDAIKASSEATIEWAEKLGLIVTGIAVALGLLAAWLIGSGISGPLRKIAGVLAELAHGNRAVDIPYTGNRDEVGDNARAAQIFKENLVRIEQMEAEQKAAEDAAPPRSGRLRRSRWPPSSRPRSVASSRRPWPETSHSTCRSRARPALMLVSPKR